MQETLIPCSCGQKFELGRGDCPYCGRSPKLTWVNQNDEPTPVVEFVRGKPSGIHHVLEQLPENVLIATISKFLRSKIRDTAAYVWCNGKVYTRDDATRSGLLRTSVSAGPGLLGWRWLVSLWKRPRRKKRDAPMSAEYAELWIANVKEW